MKSLVGLRAWASQFFSVPVAEFLGQWLGPVRYWFRFPTDTNALILMKKGQAAVGPDSTAKFGLSSVLPGIDEAQ